MGRHRNTRETEVQLIGPKMGVTFLTSLALTTLFTASYYKFFHHGVAPHGDVTVFDRHPLLLTPLIDSGEIDEARRSAIVEHEKFRDVISYSGYFTVNKEYNSNMFFWYIPAQINSKSAPVVIWLQGEPGESSLVGLFTENGPFRITDDLSIEARKSSWSESFNMLYVDNPVGAGFSFTDHEDGYVTTTIDVGLNLYEAVEQFFTLFPELRTNDVFVAGESFGGKYAVALSYLMHSLNPMMENPVTLKGLAVFSGIVDPLRKEEQKDTSIQHPSPESNDLDGFFGYEKQLMRILDGPSLLSLPQLLAVTSEVTRFFSNSVSASDSKHDREVSDAEKLSKLMESQEIKSALHAGDREFAMNSSKIEEFLQNDSAHCIMNVFGILLQNYRVLIVNGQRDTTNHSAVLEKSLMKTDWSDKGNFKKASKRRWAIDGEVAGDVKIAGNLVQVSVRDASNLVLKDQPARVVDLMKKFTAGIPIA